MCIRDRDRIKIIEGLRNKGLPTIPTKLGLELKTNPFLRVSNLEIRKNLNMIKETDSEVFEKIRLLKDNF